jgi:hypothetical protein
MFVVSIFIQDSEFCNLTFNKLAHYVFVLKSEYQVINQDKVILYLISFHEFVFLKSLNKEVN